MPRVQRHLVLRIQRVSNHFDRRDRPFQRFEAERVEGCADIGMHDRQGLLDGHGSTVRPIGGQRVEDVGDRDNPGVEFDLRSRKAPRIPLPSSRS